MEKWTRKTATRSVGRRKIETEEKYQNVFKLEEETYTDESTQGYIPLGPRDVRVMADNCWQTSILRTTAASTPVRCLVPPLKRVGIPAFMLRIIFALCLKWCRYWARI